MLSVHSQSTAIHLGTAILAANDRHYCPIYYINPLTHLLYGINACSGEMSLGRGRAWEAFNMIGHKTNRGQQRERVIIVLMSVKHCGTVQKNYIIPFIVHA